MKLEKRKRFDKYLDILDRPIRFNPFVFSRTFLLWAFLGLLGGIIAAVYLIILGYLTNIIAYFEGWQIIPAMAISGLLAGLVSHFIGDPGEINLIVNNIRFNKGKLDPKKNPSMVLSSLLCIASGGSLGPEAPLVQVTGSTGSWLGKVLRLEGEELRSLSIAGMASGFTALFGAPLGGSLFSLEILHHKHAVEYYKAIIPALVASSFSYIIFAFIIHLKPGFVWHLNAYEMIDEFDFIYVVFFAFLATIVGWIFIFCTKFLKYLFGKLNTPTYFKTLIGGIILGVIALYFPLTRYFGLNEINEILIDKLSIGFLVAILIFKILAISVAVTSGWRGGFIIPMFFLGVTLGLILHQIFPSINLALTVISCMAAINACVTRTPMSTTILLAALTGFTYMVPILFASLTGYFLAPRIPFISSQMEQEKL